MMKKILTIVVMAFLAQGAMASSVKLKSYKLKTDSNVLTLKLPARFTHTLKDNSLRCVDKLRGMNRSVYWCAKAGTERLYINKTGFEAMSHLSSNLIQGIRGHFGKGLDEFNPYTKSYNEIKNHIVNHKKKQLILDIGKDTSRYMIMPIAKQQESNGKIYLEVRAFITLKGQVYQIWYLSPYSAKMDMKKYFEELANVMAINAQNN